jgi:hypothetical protein
VPRRVRVDDDLGMAVLHRMGYEASHAQVSGGL